MNAKKIDHLKCYHCQSSIFCMWFLLSISIKIVLFCCFFTTLIIINNNYRYNLLRSLPINSNCYSANVIIPKDLWSGLDSMVSCSFSSSPISTNKRIRSERQQPKRNSMIIKMEKLRQMDTQMENSMEAVMKVLAWWVAIF